MRIVLVTTLMICAMWAPSQADQIFPDPEWQDVPHPLASPEAMSGGDISAFSGQYPKSLNYLLDNNSFTATAFSSMYETLLDTHPITADYQPGIANKWSMSDDRKTFTFWIDSAARWSDGQPITAFDVQWTYDTIMNETNLTGVHKVPLESFHRPEVIASNMVRFTAREVHWRNLGGAGQFPILPKHVYEGQDFNKVHFELPVVSGPYMLGTIKEGVFIRLNRRADWWARIYKRNQNIYNFDTITHRFYAERSNAFEAFKNGTLDVYPIYTARTWVKDALGERYDKNWILKQRIENYNPIGFQGFAMNARRWPFNDKQTRQAMSYLLNRDSMNKTLMFNQYFLHQSYYEDIYTSDSPCPNPFYDFNKDKARELLIKGGWKANPGTGILEKDGKPFTFKFLTRDPSADKFLAIYGEDLKDVGIEFTIEKKDWAAWVKDMDEFNFDMTWAAWGAGIRKDPEGSWSSKEADRASGNNITGFRNARVDEIIEAQKQIFDIHKRHEMLKEIDAILAEEAPYALLWNINATRLVYWNKFGVPSTVLSKFGDEQSVFELWWNDEDTAAELEDARASEKSIPGRPAIVKFDDAFRPR
ncbi:MAG: extracellular solute-binding protein [Verrucomicrobia bacterium]|nr:extracellular solute-binding protein [Verrucomicrobiota bacterium]